LIIVRTKVKGQKAKDKSQKAKVKRQRSKDKGQKTKVKRQRSKDKGQRSKDKSQKIDAEKDFNFNYALPDVGINVRARRLWASEGRETAYEICRSGD
jgi:hypothetical protein